MSERKVLNKYYPPDFDPSKIVRLQKGSDRKGPRQQTVRLMTPYSMKCNTCGEYIYKGRKFNARKENSGESYYSIPIFRFYIRCTRCSSEITFKTDPKNADYAAEYGASRNFEPWKEKKEEKSEEDRLNELEEEENAMTALEHKTIDSKIEMEISDALDEIRTRNAQRERLGPDQVLEQIEHAKQQPSQEAIQEEIERKKDLEIAHAIFNSEDTFVRRIRDEETPTPHMLLSQSSKNFQIPDFKTPYKRKISTSLGIKKKKLGII
ncbi:hypothetical protein PNEG_01487 [Pneumocystis murina B123]|uniref:Splicing factor YJU2 n=1 Tax=Pneumocystis murina (strain B123) TaxID=1069680 RepID=M7P8N8_PNEMU|nr:hypothetical protein PNEG_01487 [Pneumocystis murina B123]EMR10215.1 hypothetical protein PNEG_01487 [Pneumocystis murina B123]